MSGSSGANNSWTILTPEESVAETLRPLAEEAAHHGESLTSGADVSGSGADYNAERSPVEGQVVTEQTGQQTGGDRSSEQQTHVLTTAADAPATSEVPRSFVPGSDELSQSENLPESPTQSSPDPDSFSDSYTHISTSPDEPPVLQLSTETLEGGDYVQEEEGLTEEATLHLQNGEELQQEGKASDLSPRITDSGKLADSPVDSETGDEKTGEEGEPEVRRRRSLLASLERIGRTDEEEEVVEEFQLPRREEDSGFSVNKCILGAVILLGLGTIFFSESDYGTRELKDSDVPGKQEWLNPDVPPAPVGADNTEMLNKISVLQAHLQTQKEELKVARGQAAEGAMERLRWEELEKENSRLKTEMASFPVLQKEIERMKKELESVMALQKELETLRSTVTEIKSSSASEATVESLKPTTSPPSGQKEDIRHVTAGTIEKQATTPWNEPEEGKKNDIKKDKYDTGEKKEKETGKSEWKEEEKKVKTERKAGKHEQVKSDVEKDKEGKQKKQSDETKEWKKEKASRGDEGKLWKAREGKKEWTEKSERKELREEKDWKKAKYNKAIEDKQWKEKEQRKDWKGGMDTEEKNDWKVGKDREGKRDWKGGKDREGKNDWKVGKDREGKNDGKVGKDREGKKDWKVGKDKQEKKDWKGGNGNEERCSGKEACKGEKDKKKVKDDLKENGKKKWEKNEWKEKEKKEWKTKNVKEWEKEGKVKGERKQWEESVHHGKQHHGKERKKQDERKQSGENEWNGKNGKDGKEWNDKGERKQWEKKDNEWKKGEQKGKWSNERKKDESNSHQHKDEHKFASDHQDDHSEEHVWGDGKPPHSHRRPSLEQPEYWIQQRARLQHNPKPPQHCSSLETCAQTEGLVPVPLPEFEAILQNYLNKAEEAGVEASITEHLRKLSTEFFKDGVFIHDQMSFQDFVEDVTDILEDMVEGNENEEEEEEDSAIEDEMEEFEREVLEKFSAAGAKENEDEVEGELRKETRRGRG